VVFIVIANAITWGTAYLAFTPGMGLPSFVVSVLRYVAKFGPSVSAVLVVLLGEGREGLRELLRPLSMWRRSLGWYVVALLGPVGLWAVVIAVRGLTQGSVGRVAPAEAFWFVPLLLMRLFLGGGLGEEIGWRGLMLPRLQGRWGPIRASLMVGVFWGFWHAPAFCLAGTGKSGGIVEFGLFTLYCVALSIVLTWVLNASQHSLLLVVLLHASLNATNDTLKAVMPELEGEILFGLLVLAMAISLVGAAGVRALGRSTVSQK
jgi:membrane protease YdiL (CAAX protease family)